MKTQLTNYLAIERLNADYYVLSDSDGAKVAFDGDAFRSLELYVSGRVRVAARSAMSVLGQAADNPSNDNENRAIYRGIADELYTALG